MSGSRRTSRRARSRLPAIAAALLLAAPAGAAPPKPVVGVTLPPLAWMVERLAGDAVELVVMVPGTGEVETYEPTPGQIRSLASCGVYFEVGHRLLSLESSYVVPWLDLHPEVRRVSLAPAVAAGRSGAAEEAGDPHSWTSPRVLRRALPDLTAALGALLPGEQAAIRARAKGLDAELAALDAELAARFAGARGRRFLIHHPALGFLAADYGIVQLALEHEGKEPSPLRLAEIVAEARAAGARVVLVTRGTTSRAAEVVARELDGRVVEVDPLARDWPAALRAIGAAIGDALFPR